MCVRERVTREHEGHDTFYLGNARSIVLTICLVRTMCVCEGACLVDMRNTTHFTWDMTRFMLEGNESFDM